MPLKQKAGGADARWRLCSHVEGRRCDGPDRQVRRSSPRGLARRLPCCWAAPQAHWLSVGGPLCAAVRANCHQTLPPPPAAAAACSRPPRARACTRRAYTFVVIWMAVSISGAVAALLSGSLVPCVRRCPLLLCGPLLMPLSLCCIPRVRAVILFNKW